MRLLFLRAEFVPPKPRSTRTKHVFDSHTLLLFMTATLALNLTPGPDMLYVIA